MGDKDPKSRRKQESQKGVKTAALNAQRAAAIAAKAVAGKK